MCYRECLLVLVVCLVVAVPVSAQHVTSLQTPFGDSLAPVLTTVQEQKLVSGQLLQHLRLKQTKALSEGVAAAGLSMAVAIYAAQYPSIADIAALEHLGVRCMPASWIPPLEHHPLGFFIASVPVDRIADVLSLPSVLKMDSAEGESVPLNNTAAAAVKATLAWAGGWTGTGIKVAVIDSGLDYTLPKTELPDTLVYRNYGFYPDSVNSIISNTVSGHGTHVTGTVVGKGGYSTSPVVNTGNGGGAYKGMAPGANLVFLKIGRITTSTATDAAMVAAIKSAADTFHVRLLNMSYGGWDAFHDGSGVTAQAVDYAYSKGVTCFLAAGNDAAAARHYSGTVLAGQSTGYIPLTVSGAGTGNTALWFNLVWVDGAARNNLSLEYYDASLALMTPIIREATTQSPRGTESQFSHYNIYLPSGSGTYYLRVTNPSASTQVFHLYEAWGNGAVKFASADPLYTIGSPALADHALAVAAYVNRSWWTDYAGNPWSFGQTAAQIATFSSRGPRVDGVQKPNIAAPGSVVVSLRDRDVYTSPDAYWIDNDGAAGGDANYYIMQGTSMASPVAAGCGALLLQHTPEATPQQVYDAITTTTVIDLTTGPVPNSTWGYGKLDVNAALTSALLPVELVSFIVSPRAGGTLLSWRTATEVNNHGFEIERKTCVTALGAPAPRTPALWTRLGFVPGHGTVNSPQEYSFIDKTTSSGRHAYRLKQTDRDGQFAYSAEVESGSAEIPLAYGLSQNYPNPFNPSTSIEFTIAAAGQVRLTIYDLLGRQTAEVVREKLEPGAYRAEWDASRVPSGVYFYRLEAGGYSAVKKLLVQK